MRGNRLAAVPHAHRAVRGPVRALCVLWAALAGFEGSRALAQPPQADPPVPALANGLPPQGYGQWYTPPLRASYPTAPPVVPVQAVQSLPPSLPPPARPGVEGAGPAPAGQLPPASTPTQGGIDPALKALVEKLVSDRLKQEKEKDRKAADEKKDKEKKEADEKKEKEQSEGVVVGSVTGMTATWKTNPSVFSSAGFRGWPGLWFETPNKDFLFHVGGAVQYDYAAYSVDPNIETGPRGTGHFNDGANLRRGRLRAEGAAWEVIDFRFELEFANGVTPTANGLQTGGTGRVAQSNTLLTPGPTDAWFAITRMPVIGNVRVGNQKEPISLEHLESFIWLPFMERSLLFDALTPTAFNNGFTPGIMAFNTQFDDRLYWAAGVFRNSYDVYGFSLGGGQYAGTGRVAFLPWYQDNGANMIHVAVAGSVRDPVDQQDRFRVRPSVRDAPAPLTNLVPLLADTGIFSTSQEDILGLEYFMNLGSLTVQAEWQGQWCQGSSQVGRGPVGTAMFQGYYVQALYWLTGEYTRWDRKQAAPLGYVPNSPFFFVPGQCNWLHGSGAWQATARYTYVDLNSRGIVGGTVDDVTLGLNWILNQNAKIQWNYDWAHRGGISTAANGDMNAFGMRFQFNF